MKILVTYVDLIWNNYQGGSGHPTTFKTMIEVEPDVKAENIKAVVDLAIYEQRKTVFTQNDRPIIIKMEIL